jgi:hypothetical protein
MWIRSGEVVFDGTKCIKIQWRHSSMHVRIVQEFLMHAQCITPRWRSQMSKRCKSHGFDFLTHQRVVLFWGLYPINWGIIQVGNMLKWCISYSHLYFCLIRCANDVNINNRHICGQGGSIGRLRHLKHHDAPKTMAVHHTRHT